MSTDQAERKRIYVAGLNGQITEDDLKERFTKFGQVHSISLKGKPKGRQSGDDDGVFAFVELTIASDKLAKCFSAYNNTRWKGCKMEVQLAKESFLDRLKKERDGVKQSATPSSNHRRNGETSFGTSPRTDFLSKKEVRGFERSEKPDLVSSGKNGEKRRDVNGSVHRLRSATDDDFEIVPQTSLNQTGSNGMHAAKRKGRHREDAGHDGKYKLAQSVRSFGKEGVVSRPVRSDIVAVLPARLENTGRPDRRPTGSKKEMSNQRRVETIRDKAMEANARQKLIRESLKKLDSVVHANTKIVFGGESDDDRPTKAVGGQNQSQKGSETVAKKRQVNLFDNSDSERDEDDDDDRDMFRVKPQYEGEAGQKLIELQSRFGNDRRFRIDDRFAEDVADDDGSGIGDMEAEKRQQLEVLQELLGHQAIRSEAGHKEAAMTQDWSRIKRMRYDPTREDSARLEVHQDPADGVATERPKKKKKSEKVPRGGPEREAATGLETEMPSVSTDRFYEVSESLRETFVKGKKADDQPSFSLLASLGIAEPAVSSVGDGYDGTVDRPRIAWDRNPFKYDSSSDDDGGGKERDRTRPESSKEVEVRPTSHTERATFFILDGDRRLKDGVEFFQRPTDLEAAEKYWNERRSAVMDMVRNYQKHAQRKKAATAPTTKRRWQLNRSSAPNWKLQKAKGGKGQKQGGW